MKQMPVITIETTPLSKEKKEQLISGFTKVACEVTGLPAQAMTVLVHEIGADNIGVAGAQLSKMQH